MLAIIIEQMKNIIKLDSFGSDLDNTYVIWLLMVLLLPFVPSAVYPMVVEVWSLQDKKAGIDDVDVSNH